MALVMPSKMRSGGILLVVLNARGLHGVRVTFRVCHHQSYPESLHEQSLALWFGGDRCSPLLCFICPIPATIAESITITTAPVDATEAKYVCEQLRLIPIELYLPAEVDGDLLQSSFTNKLTVSFPYQLRKVDAGHRSLPLQNIHHLHRTMDALIAELTTVVAGTRIILINSNKPSILPLLCGWNGVLLDVGFIFLFNKIHKLIIYNPCFQASLDSVKMDHIFHCRNLSKVCSFHLGHILMQDLGWELTRITGGTGWQVDGDRRGHEPPHQISSVNRATCPK
ncbi:hypothetical protein JB92DRAFT_2831478 [Gautieria morchelliformis]|nr:hypothetical protein JB92DRAFT_2831478 [Gautieria morchelliformis]